MNLLPNAGFEQNQLNGPEAVPLFWRNGKILNAATNALDHLVERKVDVANARNGAALLRIFSKGGNTVNVWAANRVGRELMWEVAPGQILNFGAWAKRISGDGKLRAVLEFRDANKENPTDVFGSEIISATYGQSFGQATVPSGKYWVSFLIRVGGGTTDTEFYVDDTHFLFNFEGGVAIGVAAGSPTELQFHDTGGMLGADSSLTWDKTNKQLKVPVINDVRYLDGIKFAKTRAGLQAAFDDLPSTGGAVVIPPNTTISLAATDTPVGRNISNIALLGSGPTSIIQITGVVVFDRLIRFLGSVSSTQNLASNANEGANSLTLVAGGVAALGLAVGDYIAADDLGTGTGSPDRQVCEVTSITGEVVGVRPSLYESFTTANGARVGKITPLKNIRVGNFRIESSNAVVDSKAIGIEYAVDSEVFDIHCSGVRGATVRFWVGANNRARNLTTLDGGSSGFASLQFEWQTGMQFDNLLVDRAQGFAYLIESINGSRGSNIYVNGAGLSGAGRGVKFSKAAWCNFVNVHAAGVVSDGGITISNGTRRLTLTNWSVIGGGSAGLWFGVNPGITETNDDNTFINGVARFNSGGGDIALGVNDLRNLFVGVEYETFGAGNSTTTVIRRHSTVGLEIRGNVVLTDGIGGDPATSTSFAFGAGPNGFAFDPTNGLFFSAQRSFRFNIDSDNNETTRFFSIAKDVNAATGGTELLRVSEDGIVLILATGKLQIGSNPAPTGAIGLDNNAAIHARDLAGTSEFSLIKSTNNAVEVGQGTIPLILNGNTISLINGDLVADLNLTWKSGTAFKGILDHVNTADRTYTFPNVTGNVPSLPTAATTETGTGALVRQTSPNILTQLSLDTDVVLKRSQADRLMLDGDDLFLKRVGAAQARFGNNDTYEGGFLFSFLAHQGDLAGGASYDGTNVTARATSASIVECASGQVNFFGNLSLTVGVNFSPTILGRFDPTIASGETALLVRRNVGGTLSFQRVSMGVTDSGGAGFKLLRVPN